MDSDVEWKSIVNLVGKIGEEADRLDWQELADMAVSALEEMEKEKDPAIILFVWQQFFFRLYYRVKKYSQKLEFNTVYETSRLENHQDRKFYQVNNYDYKMFVWAKKKGFMDYTTNNFLLVPMDKLSEKEKENFEKKCENHYG